MNANQERDGLLHWSAIVLGALAPLSAVGIAGIAGVGTGFGGALAVLLGSVWGLSVAAMAVEAVGTARRSPEEHVESPQLLERSASDAVVDEAASPRRKV